MIFSSVITISSRIWDKIYSIFTNKNPKSSARDKNSASLFKKALTSIDNSQYNNAIVYLLGYIDISKNIYDISTAYLYCGFLNNKLHQYENSIIYFSNAIRFFQTNINSDFDSDAALLSLSYRGRSEANYKLKAYEASILDKRSENKLVKVKNNRLNNNLLTHNFKQLIKLSLANISRYDLIQDYKKFITDSRKHEIISMLEEISEFKFSIGDYRGSIKALRRADKYIY